MFRRYEKHQLISFDPFHQQQGQQQRQDNSEENRAVSKHELRIQRSLSNLNIPDWYKQYGPPPGTNTNTNYSYSLSSKRNFGSSTGLAGGWAGLSSSKTTSLTSLQSPGYYSDPVSSISPSRVKNTASVGGRTSQESLRSATYSTGSASLSSSYYERRNYTYGVPYGLSRFANGTGRLSRGASPSSLSPSPSPSPIAGVRSYSSSSTPEPNAKLSSSFTKQPYLGWRSQERLNSQPTFYRTPSQRLSADIFARRNRNHLLSDPGTFNGDVYKWSPGNENLSNKSTIAKEESEPNNKQLEKVRTSIKEVSNAIVDFVNELKPLENNENPPKSKPQTRSAEQQRQIWMESSFVGKKPIREDSPGYLDDTVDEVFSFEADVVTVPIHDPNVNGRISNGNTISKSNGVGPGPNRVSMSSTSKTFNPNFNYNNRPTSFLNKNRNS